MLIKSIDNLINITLKTMGVDNASRYCWLAASTEFLYNAERPSIVIESPKIRIFNHC